MTFGELATFAHVISGPVDAAIELGVPIAIFISLYWWSNRTKKVKKE